MSDQQAQLIVELAETLQFLPASARVLAWCRLVNSVESLADNQLQEPLTYLIPHLRDVTSDEFSKYHDLMSVLVRRVPGDYKKKVIAALRKEEAILPPPLKTVLSFGNLSFGG